MDGLGNIAIFIESLSRIEAAIQRRSFARQFHRDKIGEGCLFAIDESKGMLAVYSSARVRRSFGLVCSAYDQFSIDAAPYLFVGGRAWVLARDGIRNRPSSVL